MTQSVAVSAIEHHERVEHVAAQVRRSGGAAHVAKAGVHHVVPLPGDRRFAGEPLDTSALTHIIDIDTENARATCEPGVSFEQLVAATLPLGLVPAVVPELRGITLGGAVAGCSVESMSWKVGGFHDTCLRYEVVTGDGRIVELSPSQHPELFHHIHGSYGTLGIVTEITCTLLPAEPFVEMSYVHLHDLAAFRRELRESCELAGSDDPSRPQFVDGIVVTPEHFVLCLGRFTDDPAGREPSDYNGTEIFHRSVVHRDSDLLRTEDYLFRYDTECHWLTETIPPLTWRWLRRLVGRWFLGSTNLITWANRTAPLQRRLLRRPDMVVDVFIPESRLDDFWRWYVATVDFWPLWVVPYRPPSPYPWLSERIRAGLESDDLFIDLAVYGKPNRHPTRDLSEELERQLDNVGGIKTLIGRNHYDEERFWSVYDRPAYDHAKSELDPNGRFPDLYAKLGKVN